MTTDGIASLAAQRVALREQLQAQRRKIAGRLVPALEGRGAYPRSLTMRLLIQRPALVAMIVTPIAGKRFAASAPAILAAVELLCAALAANAGPFSLEPGAAASPNSPVPP